MAKYKCIVECSVEGKRVKLGDTFAHSDPQIIRRLLGMGRIEEVKEEAKAKKPATKLPGT